MEQQPSTGLGEWDVAQFVHDDAIGIDQLFLKASCFFIGLFFDEQIDQVDAIEEADFPSTLYQVRSECCRDVCFSCSRSPRMRLCLSCMNCPVQSCSICDFLTDVLQYSKLTKSR